MSPGPYRILYVEDDEMNRDLVRRILTRAGYVIFEAKDGLTGIQIAQKERLDLILMDIVLPGMDGHQVTTRLKSMPELARTPIVALTAKATPSDRERALVAGCDGYITKPFDVDLLPAQIAEFIEGKREGIDGGMDQQSTLQREYTQELVFELEKKVQELQRANAELRHTDERKSRFIAMASHELRTPLAVIQGYLQVFQASAVQLEESMSDTALQSLTGMGKGLQRLKAIIEDMLDIVRIESKTILTHREPTMIKGAVMAAVRRLEPAAKERHLKLKVGSMRRLPLVSTDPDRLMQVFFNLLSNAVKYTPDGGRINISVKVVRGKQIHRINRFVSSSGDYLHIVVKDTGIGIAPEEQEHIFDLFYEARDVSLHSTSKTRFLGSGLGLGLTIARGVVEAHGGLLWAESAGHDREKCPGSSFHILLPVED